MRVVAAVCLTAGLGVLAGCGDRVAKFEGPTVKEFTGKLVHNAKPVSFLSDDKVSLKLIHEKGESFGVPIQTDGTFKIGWMPVGKYTANLIREKDMTGTVKGGSQSAPNMYGVPDGLTIVDGQTDYVIELGKNYKP